jgi:hypothetical protein
VVLVSSSWWKDIQKSRRVEKESSSGAAGTKAVQQSLAVWETVEKDQSSVAAFSALIP